MNLEKELNVYGRTHNVVPQENQIEETIMKSMEAFHSVEEHNKLSYMEFFRIQLKVIRKRWWILQAIVLCVMWQLLFLSEASFDVQRGMSIAAALFVVLIIPELWKNRESNSMEIEAAAYYSLKQVYAVRLIAFGTVDVFLLTLFCMITTVTQSITAIDMMKQFIFPIVIVAAICFVLLSSKNMFHEVIAIAGCLMASAAWTAIVMNDQIYDAITPAVWGSIFAVAVIVFITSVRKVLCNCNRYWEVKSDGIEIG